ncbi:lytic transglycosylase domain-containing protein [Cohnella faecalis]|uniref:Lytic transglycosylase domain-containing protein n=1 Tax=Cohnella faecalis TaxID=2315694 RepID=A0A398CKU3_9BACL|nr:lytic transglycosylase domain-containing protein [Cohnella faecalis]RIE02920.1 lytic transglycosylase domain-containing protein [Cohnella faecalis]
MNRINKKIKRKRVLLPLVLLVLGVLFIQSEWLGRMIYPLSYTEEIRSSAKQFGVDPLLVAAVIRVESNFKPEAVSSKGAVGIMQIMPETAKWILKKEHFEGVSIDDVRSEPHAGIQLGTWYIRDLHRQFQGNRIAALAAYNAGPGKVRQWLNEEVWDGSEETLRNIPYGETRHYVQRVMYYYKKYSKLYDSSL